MGKLISALKDSIFAYNGELIAEYAEIGIDALLESNTLKSIPIVNTLIAVCKTGYNLHERNLIKQTLAFISAFNDGSISQEKWNAHCKKLEDNPKKSEKELSRILIILGKQIDQIQSKVLGKFYAAFINSKISWEKFCELSEVNRRMFINDYALLVEAAANNRLEIQDNELYQVDRMISLGLLQNQNRLGGNVLIKFEDNSKKQKDIIVTSLGMTFYNNASSVLEPLTYNNNQKS